VDVASSASNAMRIVRSSVYEVGILDLGLPDQDGLDLLRTWRREGLTLPVLILSARGNVNDRIDGLDSGADDYLIKPFALSEIEARLRALLRRPKRVVRQQVGRLRFDWADKRAVVGGKEVDLTKRELEVLAALMSHPGKVVGKQALIDAVFTCDADVGPNALEIHISRLRQKLKPASVHIRALRGLGYRIEDTSNARD
jgi:two-component system, OmpR family, response regulator